MCSRPRSSLHTNRWSIQSKFVDVSFFANPETQYPTPGDTALPIVTHAHTSHLAHERTFELPSFAKNRKIYLVPPPFVRKYTFAFARLPLIHLAKYSPYSVCLIDSFCTQSEHDVCVCVRASVFIRRMRRLGALTRFALSNRFNIYTGHVYTWYRAFLALSTFFISFSYRSSCHIHTLLSRWALSRWYYIMWRIFFVDDGSWKL